MKNIKGFILLSGGAYLNINQIIDFEAIGHKKREFQDKPHIEITVVGEEGRTRREDLVTMEEFIMKLTIAQK
jgi:hypothetical protein